MNTNLNQQLIVIAPTSPQGTCGVSDYSYKTAQVLSEFYTTVSIGVDRIPISEELSYSSPVVVDRWKQLVLSSIVSKQPCDLLLNYTPASYAWSCLPVDLMRTLKQFKKAHPDNNVFVFVHEAWNSSIKLRLHNIIRNRLAKWSINRIGKMAGGIAVVTEGQKKDLTHLLRNNSIHLSLVGANILPVRIEDGLESSRQMGMWVVFGQSHSRLWALQAYMPLLKAMYAEGVLKKLHAIGPIDTKYSPQERALIAENLAPDVLVQLGLLGTEEVSKQLLNAGAALVKQDADSLRKSGSFAALTAHAVPIICEISSTLSDPPGQAVFRPAEVMENPGIISDQENDWRRRQLHAWFWSTRSWEAIGQDIRQWMK